MKGETDMDWWLILIIFMILVIILWWALSRQAGEETVAVHHEPAAAAEPDDLTRIEGVGPKVQELLNQAGISTFAELAKRTPEQLTETLDAAGSIYKAMDKKIVAQAGCPGR